MRDDVRRLLLSPLPLFVALGVAMLWLHEPWRDEAQPWLIARDAPNLLAQMDSEGSPALWYLILFPFAKVGLPFASARVLHLALATTALALVVYASPFSRLEHWLLAGSYLFAYEYAVIARGYVLTILALFALAIHHARRREHPWRHGALLLVLANTTGLGTAMAAALAAGYGLEALWERGLRRFVAICVPAAAGLALAAWQMWPSPDLAWWRTYAVKGYRWTSVLDVARAISQAFVPIGEWGGWRWNHNVADGNLSEIGLMTMAIAILVVSCLPLLRRPRVLLLWILMAGSLGALYYTRSGVAGQMRHHGMLVVAWVFCVWVARLEPAAFSWRAAKRPAAAWTLALVLLVQMGGLAQALQADATTPFSAGPVMAHMLQERGATSRNTLVGVYPDFIAASILTTMGDDMPELLLLQQARMGSWVRWTTTDLDTFNNPGHVEAKLLDYAAAHGPYEHVYLIMSVTSGDVGNGWRLVAHVDAMAPGDGFYLYERTP